MKTKERLERAGWVFQEYYANLEVYVRNRVQLFYYPDKDEIVLVIGPGVKPYKPKGIEIELVCSKENLFNNENKRQLPPL